MAKLTETFKDKNPAPGPGFIMPNGGMKVIAAHEPLKNETFEIKNDPHPIIDPTPKVAPAVEPQPLKVALIGTAPSSRLLAPYSDPSWTIWGCSPGNMNVLPRFDAWFELHGNLLWPEHKHYGEPYIAWMKNLPVPLYMQNQDYCPNAITFPKDEMVKEFGRNFFTSSFSWMLAFAIMKGAKEIGLYGIDMASRDEYILQRPGAYFFFHEAQRRGIKIIAPNESDIMQPPGLYGYSEVTPLGRKMLARAKEIDDRLASMKAERDKLTHNITYLEGAREDIDYFSSIWMGQG